MLGTAGVHDPEQVKGSALDKRSDIWAFGCLLYEMLTGRRAFACGDPAATFASVLKQDPEWQALPPDLPESVRTLLAQCLTKDRRQRIADMAIAIDGPTRSPAQRQAPEAPPFVLVAFDPWLQRRGWLRRTADGRRRVGDFSPATREASRLTRLSLVTSARQPLAFHGINTDIDISPDGAFVVYRSGSATQWQLLVRPLNGAEARPLRTRSGQPAVFFARRPVGWVLRRSAAQENDHRRRSRRCAVPDRRGPLTEGIALGAATIQSSSLTAIRRPAC